MIRFGVCIREILPIKPILKVEQLFPRATNLSLLLTLKLLRQQMILGGFLPAFQRICKSRTGSMEKRTPRHEQIGRASGRERAGRTVGAVAGRAQSEALRGRSS